MLFSGIIHPMSTSNLIISASFFLHLLATVGWIGGLVTLALVVQPVLDRSAADAPTRARCGSVAGCFPAFFDRSCLAVLRSTALNCGRAPSDRFRLILSNQQEIEAGG